MSTLGLVLVIGVGGLRGGADVRGVLFGLGAAAFYAAVILLNKFIRSVAGIQRTLLQFLAAIVILIPLRRRDRRRIAEDARRARLGLPAHRGASSTRA